MDEWIIKSIIRIVVNLLMVFYGYAIGRKSNGQNG